MPGHIVAIDPFSRLDDVYAVYCAAIGEDSGSQGAREWRDAILPRHARNADFVFLAALDDDSVVGIAYGYTGAYGQWWTDRVAKGMDDPARAEWLDPPHFEVCELHVRPDAQRGGIGSRLLDELLARQPHDRALLSTDPDNRKAVPFYAKHGWRRVGSLGLPKGTYVVLGKAGLGVEEGGRAVSAARERWRPG